MKNKFVVRMNVFITFESTKMALLHISYIQFFSQCKELPQETLKQMKDQRKRLFHNHSQTLMKVSDEVVVWYLFCPILLISWFLLLQRQTNLKS